LPYTHRSSESIAAPTVTVCLCSIYSAADTLRVTLGSMKLMTALLNVLPVEPHDRRVALMLETNSLL